MQGWGGALIGVTGRQQYNVPPSAVALQVSAAGSLEEQQQAEELLAQLWARTAQEALGLQQLKAAQAAASRSVSRLPSDPTARASVPGAVWRWWSLAECVWGQALAALVRPEQQEQAVQDSLRFQACNHFTVAAG